MGGMQEPPVQKSKPGSVTWDLSLAWSSRLSSAAHTEVTQKVGRVTAVEGGLVFAGRL